MTFIEEVEHNNTGLFRYWTTTEDQSRRYDSTTAEFRLPAVGDGDRSAEAEGISELGMDLRSTLEDWA